MTERDAPVVGHAAGQTAPLRQELFSTVSLAVATAGIVCSPYATMTLPRRVALVVQACLILFFTLAALAPGLLRAGWWGRVLTVPRGVRLGVLLYGGTAAFATLVALARGNEPALVAGQLLSMGLLPLGFFAAAANASENTAPAFAWALVGVTATAAVAHFVHWGWRVREGEQLMRLFMRNGVSVGGVALLALLLAVALAAGSRAWRRRVACLMAALIAVYIVGTGTRSLWLATVVGFAAVVVSLRAWKRLGSWRVTAPLASLALLFVASGVMPILWVHLPRANMLPDADTLAEPFWAPSHNLNLIIIARRGLELQPEIRWHATANKSVVTLSNPIAFSAGNSVYRFTATIDAAAGAVCAVHLALSRWPQTPCEWVALRKSPHNGPEVVSGVVLLPEMVITAQVLAEAEVGSACRISGMSLERLGPPQIVAPAVQALYIIDRFRGMLSALQLPTEATDSSISFRVKEITALAAAIGSSSASARLWGNGLGARFLLQSRGFDVNGQQIWFESPNYIHNFYAFLLYKTGIIGTAAVIVALALWLLALARAARAPGDPTARRLAEAGLAALAAYMVWSLACPEILDFRVAPLWGFVLGALTGRSHQLARSA